MLALPPIPADYDYESVVVCGIVTGTRGIIAAGRSFFESYEQRPEEDCCSDENSVEEEADPNSPHLNRTESKRNKKKEQFSGNALRLSALTKDVNLYKILSVSESCSGDDIKKSYRKLVLEKHPDKLTGTMSAAEEEKARNEFLRIQEAFEVLSDERNRRLYDSSLPADDTIPSEKDFSTEEEFYTVFAAAFARNERWCIARPIPTLGTGETSRDQVEKFYDFWFNKFESWRDFSHHDEHDLKHADSRDERRWMEVQNARIRKKRLAEETARVRRLVDTAEKLDPRVRRWKAADFEAANAEKRRRQEEREAKARAEEERKQEEERQRAAKAMEADLEKEKAKNEKVEIKRTRGEIRQVLGLNDAGVSIDAVKIEQFNQGLIGLLNSVDKAREVLDRAKSVASEPESVEQFVDEIVSLTAPPSRTSSVPVTPAPASVSAPETPLKRTASGRSNPAPVVVSEKELMDWTADELQLLTRGMQKFPVGTYKRWEVIQGLIGGSRTVPQIIEMSKRVASQKVIEPAVMVGSRKHAETAAAPDVDYERQAAVKAEPAAPVVESKTVGNEWSAQQQKQLEDAMKQYPATLAAAERWALIADAVEGKTKNQCVARFKYIRELVSKKK